MSSHLVRRESSHLELATITDGTHSTGASRLANSYLLRPKGEVTPDSVRLLGLQRIIRLHRMDGGRGAAWIRQALLSSFRVANGRVVGHPNNFGAACGGCLNVPFW